MARKLRGFERVLDAPALFAVAYGEIASSLYIALGIVAGVALGLTPLVLLVAGAAFVLVSLSYAEGTTALPETGGAATFVRRAFNDLAGFVTGWVLFLDFLIVIALSAVFAPHYLAGALGEQALRESPWDAIVGCGLILAIAGVRILRRTRMHLGALAIALLDLVVQSLLVLLGLAMLLSPSTLVDGLGFATGQDWSDLAFALPLAMLAYTGLETVANLAEETTEPGRTLPRSLFSAIGLVVVVTVLIGAIGLSAYPVRGRRDCARRGVARAATRRDRRRFRRVASVGPRRCARGRGRDLRRPHPHRRGDDVVLRDHPADVLAGRARLAPAGIRAARAPRGRLERGDRARGGASDRADRPDGSRSPTATRPSSRASTRSASSSRSRPRSSRSSACACASPTWSARSSRDRTSRFAVIECPWPRSSARR